MYLVNKNQCPDERRLKYALCLDLGDDSGNARRRRDFRWNKIARVHGWPSLDRLNENLKREKGLDLGDLIPNYDKKCGKNLEPAAGGPPAL